MVLGPEHFRFNILSIGVKYKKFLWDDNFVLKAAQSLYENVFLHIYN